MTTAIEFDSAAMLAQIMEYLTHENNNQIRGFYHFDGYWTRKNKAMESLSPDLIPHLDEVFDLMSSITIADIVEKARTEGREWMRKYANYGPGRRSESQKMMSRVAAAHTTTSFILKNWEILQRVRFHIGAFLNKLTREEVVDHITKIADSELNSTFWKDQESRFSNTVFRLEIAKSWLEDTDHEDVVDDKLRHVALQWLSFHNLLNNLDDDPVYKAAMQRANNLTDQIFHDKGVINSLEGRLSGAKKVLSDHEAELREIGKGTKKGMNYAQIAKLQKLAEDPMAPCSKCGKPTLKKHLSGIDACPACTAEWVKDR